MSTEITLNKESQVLKISTNQSSPSRVKKYEPLMVFNELNPLLNEVMPEYNFKDLTLDPIEISERLKITMKVYGGIGLAANQCGLKLRVFVIGNENDALTCFNPRIVNISDRTSIMKEGCLSFPGLFFKIKRPDIIEVEYENEKGETMRANFSGLTSHCFQHELDHLNGIKYTSHVGETSLIMARRQKEKLIKKYKRGKL